MNENYAVIVIGAGAAGLMCAITAAKRGKKVLILDHANKVGKKILMSGGGRCNFTNYSIEPENYLSENPHFCKSALSRYNQWNFIELVEKYQIDYYDKGLGQLFCKKSSKDIRDLLLNECRENKVDIFLKTSITQIRKNNDKQTFTVNTENQGYLCQSVVIATGGLSIPTMGASGFGYQIAEQFGHKVLPTTPALSPLTFDKRWLNKTHNLPGNSLDVIVTCNAQSFKEAMLFTHKGLSGPAILQISSYWRQGEPLSINLLPDLNVADWIKENRNTRPDIQMKTLLASEMSQSLANFFCDEFHCQLKLKQIDEPSFDKIVNSLTNWTIYPSGLEGYRVAEVTLGGVDTSNISSKTFESSLCGNLFFIGEVLDVTGHLGGYNFQWAWASGYAAGNYV